ncbi:T9SS type B sorting domain-containing protein, partial [Mesonia aquimarina]|uniref:T9SS type B sorting domain-containing protein n=1 Tax=Mesonia aquimarina TaxID=1504967 RepID=UPI0013CF287D
EQTPVLVQPAPLQLCAQDYDNDPFAQMEFDLTVKEGEIADQDPAPNSYVFTYYASQADLEADQPITDPTAYQNIANPQTVYVEVTNSLTENNCSNVISLTIEVLPLPSPSETDLEALRLQGCDDDNDGVAVDPFNLIQSGQLIAGGENVEISYYKTEFAAEEGDETAAEFIADPSNYINEPSFNEQNEEGLSVQVIYARVDSGINGNFCYVIVPFELQVIGAPVLNPAGDPNFGYTLCEDGSSGEAAVNFDDITENLYDPVDGDPSTIIPLLDPATDQDQNIDNYTVTYYAFEEDAEDGVDPLQNGELATNGTLYYIRVEYTNTGCFNTDAIGVVEITVEERPSIVDQPIAEEFCSDEPGGDSVSIDLTQYNDQVNPGSPQGTAVVYYADQTAYENGEAIQEPSFYTTVSNPQTVIVETINTTTLCESPSVAEITISVNDRPLVDISDYDGLYICEDSNPQTPVEGGNYDPIIIDTGLNESDYSFVWTLDGVTLNEDGASISADQAGTYEVTVSDQDGSIVCSTSSSATITAGNPPEFEVSPLTLSFEEDHAILVSNISGEGDYEFRLDNGPWQAAAADGTLTFTDVEPGEHLVYGRDINGCGTTVKVISFIDYPKFFTPNQDGYNDTWNIIGLQDQPQAKVYIFDRYGKLIKQISPVGEGWDGTYNGKPMPSNDYWFRVEYSESLPDGSQQPREFKANFTLKR